MKRIYFTLLVAISIVIIGGIIHGAHIFGSAGSEPIIITTSFITGIVVGIGMTRVNVKDVLMKKECSFLE